MLQGDKFIISFPVLNDSGGISTVLGKELRGLNYFADYNSRETMCCNCDSGSGSN